MNEKIFREYDIRGIAETDLPSDIVLKLGMAIGAFVHRKGGDTLTVGRDCRKSSDRIFKALAEGLTSVGIHVVDIGHVPTPVLYFSVFERNCDGGIMITGSHNPGDYNGLKVCVGRSTIHGTDIQEIRKLVQAGDFPLSEGSLSQYDVKPAYIKKVTSGFKTPLSVKVVVDSGNGMGGVVAPEILRKLGAEVIELYSEPDGTFPNHHPDPTVLDNLKELTATVKREGAQLGIGFDGDADRIGVVDACGRVLFGDELLILYARQVLAAHPGAPIISEVKASHRLFKDIEKHGGKPVMWKTGHSLIKSKMKELKSPLAGEMSGHMFFADRYFGYDDAVYAAARIVEIVAEARRSPAELLSDVPESWSTAELRVDCADEKKFSVVEQAKAFFLKQGLSVNDIDGARVEFGDGWGLVRASNTQPVLVYRFEAQSQNRLQEIRKTVEDGVAQFL
ncbi:MAG: phosphomannomutase/phosphoglucomutase [Bdellovibrionales bacterium]|nr:phosphomannomutase/phosphoglucomutase [Bdellovibrionales bacterium]